MTIRQALTGNLHLKLLSLALAAALWLLATGSKEEVVDVSVPVLLRNVPPGLVAAGKVPDRINVAVAGPRLRLLGLRPRAVSLELDLENLGEGTATFGGIEKRLRVPAGVEVLRVYPTVVEIRLVRVPLPGVKQRDTLPATPAR